MVVLEELGAVLHELIRQHLEPAPSFIGAVLVGSRAHDEGRPNSDVDIVFVFEEVDERIIPGEFVWIPANDSFHSIFEVEASEVGGIQIDAIAKRVAWSDFATADWPEGLRHDLAVGQVLYERGRDLSGLLRERTAYPEDLRLRRLAETTGWCDYYLEEWRLERWVSRGGWLGAHDQLEAALSELIRALHAYNRTWMPWSYRRIVSTLKLEWLPEGFADGLEAFQARAPRELDGLRHRSNLLRGLLGDLEERLREEGVSDQIEPLRWADFAGLGFASNMDEWREAHDEWRHASRQATRPSVNQ